MSNSITSTTPSAATVTEIDTHLQEIFDQGEIALDHLTCARDCIDALGMIAPGLDPHGAQLVEAMRKSLAHWVGQASAAVTAMQRQTFGR